MAFDQDPTPCPQRLGQSSLLMGADPTVTLPGYSESFRNVKPRRPRNNRQSVGWDPAVDIYTDDTFAFQYPTAVTAAGLQQEGSNLKQSRAERRTTLFAQPPQRPIAQRHSEFGDLNKRRRVSIAPAPVAVQQAKQIPQASNHVCPTYTAGHGSGKESRRETSYVLSEETITNLTFPKALNKTVDTRPRPPRQSDVFLDLASFDHGGAPQPMPPPPLRKASRASLAGAPRRGPLQQSFRPLQIQSIPEDVQGSGEGKENVPPGSLLNVKPSIKRASMMLPNKVMISRDSHHHKSKFMNPVVEVHHDHVSHNPYASRIQRSIESLSEDSIPTDLRPSRRSLAHSDHARSVMNKGLRRSTLVPQPAVRDILDNRPMRIVDQTPVLPRVNQSRTLTQSIYPPLQEHISNPEMYEDDWLRQQEEAMTQLINSLFEKKHQPSSIRSKKRLRRSVLKIYQEPGQVLLYRRLQASLNFGALSLPTQTLPQVASFRSDLGHRQRFLDLWLKTYDIKTLETAAEVVVGRENIRAARISSSSSPKTRQCQTVETFLKTFLIDNQDVSHAPPNHSRTSISDNTEDIGSPAWSWRRTALRSLMLILLLDKAQSKGLLQRCLFQPTSPYKSSSAVLQGLCKILLPSIGDVPRVLGHLNFGVSYIQYPLQEFDYPIHNLATELRDGIRLTRLVETLLYPPSSLAEDHSTLTVTLPNDVLRSRFDVEGPCSWPLSQHLKLPCLARPLKLYNVQIALSALQNINDVTILDGITADDIVDGHREKTLRLLWSLMGRWGLESFVDFALVKKEITRLQKAYLGKRPASSVDGKDGSSTKEAQDSHIGGLERSTKLLQEWSHHIGRSRGVQIDNLSTSFADCKAYQVIADEYTSCLSKAFLNKPETGEDEAVHQAGARPLASVLRSQGCSQAFIDLFQTPSTAPCTRTVIPQLAFLASRLIGPSQPYFAVKTIQRNWRLSRARFNFKKRLMLAILARDCATVVNTSQRIMWAATTIQKKWKEVCWK